METRLYTGDSFFLSFFRAIHTFRISPSGVIDAKRRIWFSPRIPRSKQQRKTTLLARNAVLKPIEFFRSYGLYFEVRNRSRWEKRHFFRRKLDVAKKSKYHNQNPHRTFCVSDRGSPKLPTSRGVRPTV